MPPEEKLVTDFEHWEAVVDDLAEWVDRIYYNPEISVFSNKPQISYLRTAADFLRTNLKIIKDDYIRRKAAT